MSSLRKLESKREIVAVLYRLINKYYFVEHNYEILEQRLKGRK